MSLSSPEAESELGASVPAPASRRLAIALAWLPPLLYTALIWWLSSQVLDIQLIAYVPLRDRGVHLVEYGVLALLLARAVHVTWPERGLRGALFAVLLGFALGLLDEVHQLFVPGRSADILDLVADTAGACVAVGCYAAFTTSRAASSTAD
jgi:VanZ family protein